MSRGELDAQGIALNEAASLEPAGPALPDLLAPLAPQRTGWTHSPQPRLYWYLSKPWSGAVGFSLNRADRDAPVIEIDLPQPAGGAYAAGVHAVDLARHGVALEPGVDYEWFVYIVPDPVERSADLLASAAIRYVPGAAAGVGDYATLAHDGLWYDAIQALSEGIARRPGDATLRAHRAGLIDQVGMPKVALFDRGAGR